MIEKLKSAIREHELLTAGDRVLVAVSGGIDSIVLLHGLYQLREELGITLSVVHVDHGLRGEESAEDARFVQKVAGELLLPLFSRTFDVAAYAAANQVSTQMAAREVRYQYIEEVAKQIGAQKVVTAHHADDQAETVLMRILRGTTLRGVAGIPERREERGLAFVRPLLSVWREEIAAYARQHGLSHREDPSNASTKYLRNKIRIQLLPQLASEYNQGVKDALVQLAGLAREDDSYLSELAHKAFNEQVCKESESLVTVDVKRLLGLPLPLQRRVITLILYYLRGHTRQWEQIHIESIRHLLLTDRPSAEIALGGGVRAWREYDRLHVGDRSQLQEVPSVPLAVGEHVLPPYGIRLELAVVEGVPPRAQDPWEAQFDADELSGSRIYIRTWAQGDRMKPLGLPGTKLISDVLGEAKVPKAQRATWPLLCVDDAIAWVVGIRRAEIGRITGETRRTLIVRATSLS